MPTLRRSGTTPSHVQTSQTHGPDLLGVSITFCALAILVVCHRIWFVFRHRGWLGREENVIILATALLTLLTVVGGLAVHNGFGHHMAAIPSIGGNVEEAMMWYFVFKILYKIIVSAKKLAFLLLYLRLFPNALMRKIFKVSIGVVIVAAAAFTIATLNQCDPADKSWEPSLPGQCINKAALEWSWVGFDLGSDLIISFLPFSSIRSLRMPRARKFGVMALFGLSLISCAICAGRAAALANGQKNKHDSTYHCTITMIWSAVEASVGIILACAPSLKAPISRFLKLSVQTQRNLSRSYSERSQNLEASRSRLNVTDDRKPAMHETRPAGLFSELDSARSSRPPSSISRPARARSSQKSPRQTYRTRSRRASLPIQIPLEEESIDEKQALQQHEHRYSGSSDGSNSSKKQIVVTTTVATSSSPVAMHRSMSSFSTSPMASPLLSPTLARVEDYAPVYYNGEPVDYEQQVAGMFTR